MSEFYPRLIAPGIYPTGSLNAITDVPGVRVGHFTLIEGEDIRTGATAILPHPGNLFQNKVPAGIAVANGFGKLMGFTQVEELGEIETPILLTNTLCVPRAAEAIIDWTLAQPGNEDVRSLNPVVGETNDGVLNNIRKRALTVQHHRMAIEQAQAGALAQGCVGAGAGTMAFGLKGGIGTSSRVLPEGYMLGVLAQSNFGGILSPLPPRVISRGGVGGGSGSGLTPEHPAPAEHGSIIIVIATNAPLSDRNLKRVARRAFAGMARTGASFSNGSGDYAIAFSVAQEMRRSSHPLPLPAGGARELQNNDMSPLFQAVNEATEEAIYNSLLFAQDTRGFNGSFAKALRLKKEE